MNTSSAYEHILLLHWFARIFGSFTHSFGLSKRRRDHRYRSLLFVLTCSWLRHIDYMRIEVRELDISVTGWASSCLPVRVDMYYISTVKPQASKFYMQGGLLIVIWRKRFPAFLQSFTCPRDFGHCKIVSCFIAMISARVFSATLSARAWRVWVIAGRFFALHNAQRHCSCDVRCWNRSRCIHMPSACPWQLEYTME